MFRFPHLDASPNSCHNSNATEYRQKNNKFHNLYSLDFDKAINANPAKAKATTDMPPKMKSKGLFTSSFIILAKMMPPNTNLDISMKNFPTSASTASFLSFSILQIYNKEIKYLLFYPTKQAPAPILLSFPESSFTSTKNITIFASGYS